MAISLVVYKEGITTVYFRFIEKRAMKPTINSEIGAT
jgi:hypothetical protein